MITREEYELLKNYRAECYSYLSRDKDNLLCVNMYKPRKLNERWLWGTNHLLLNRDTLKCVRWEDEEPTRITDLINEYESHKEVVGENVKVVIPSFVAEWIEEVKALTRNFKLEYLFDTTEMPDDVYDWLDEHGGDTDILAKAWLDGFEVEKEKLYTVRLANGSILIKDPEFNTFQLCIAPKEQIEGYEYKLTQFEIESVDPRLMQFAVVVE